MPMATDCLAFINNRKGTGFQCCCTITATCSVHKECAGGISFINTGAQFPAPSITMIKPQGGTIINITRSNHGVTLSDFTANSITLTSGNNSVQCTPINEGYMSGREVQCRISLLPVGLCLGNRLLPSGKGSYKMMIHL